MLNFLAGLLLSVRLQGREHLVRRAAEMDELLLASTMSADRRERLESKRQELEEQIREWIPG